jgi:hypothetical protein
VGLLRDDEVEDRGTSLSALPNRLEQTAGRRGLVGDDENMGRI